ncbi:hypothetical protein [Mycobacterium haemophilum]|nr:hypothetical protein [Mycobacterium haemophilum]
MFAPERDLDSKAAAILEEFALALDVSAAQYAATEADNVKALS